MISGVETAILSYEDRIRKLNQVQIGDYRTVVVPNINFDLLIATQPFGTSRKNLSREELREWVIFFTSYFFRRSLRHDIQISSTDLKLLNDRYYEFTDWMRHVRILRVENYRVGVKYNSYKIRGTGFKELPIYNQKIIGHMISKKMGAPGEFDFLRLGLGHLEIIPHSALFIMERTSSSIERDRLLQKAKLSAWEIRNKDFTFVHDPNTTRLYTTVTMMLREQRQFLRYKGQRLYEVDMSNAMPFLALAFFLKRPYKLLKVDKLLREKSALFQEKYVSQQKEFLKNVSTGTYSLYANLVCKGELYNYLMDKYPKLANNRVELKEKFFYTLFNVSSKRTRLKHILCREFPTEMKIFDLIKVGFERTRKQGRRPDEQTNALCMILYHIESYIFLQKAARRFHNEYPEAGIFTVHDAILTTKEYLPLLRDIIKEETFKLYGVMPTVKSE